MMAIMIFEPEEERRRSLGGVYSYSADTIEGPRSPAVKTARHSSLTRVRAAEARARELHRVTVTPAGTGCQVSVQVAGPAFADNPG